MNLNNTIECVCKVLSGTFSRTVFYSMYSYATNRPNNNRCCNELQAFPSSDCYEITTTVAYITDKCHGEVHLK